MTVREAHGEVVGGGLERSARGGPERTICGGRCPPAGIGVGGCVGIASSIVERRRSGQARCTINTPSISLLDVVLDMIYNTKA